MISSSSRCVFLFMVLAATFYNLHANNANDPNQYAASTQNSMQVRQLTTSASEAAASTNHNDTFPSIPIRTTSKVVFYHVYLPQKDAKNALRIVEEQLGQLGGQDHDVTLLYNTIGNRDALPHTQMNAWCQEHNLTACHHLDHYDSGMETVTLDKVHGYCQQHPEQRVGYVHNKGSHHKNKKNEVWRYLMTEALVREECWTKNNNSNACGLYFTHDQGHYFAGNVWTADCGYVQNLVPPKDYARRQMEVFQDALFRKELGQFEMTIWDYRKDVDRAGIGRYADEWWLASHPAFAPSDFSKNVQHKRGFPTWDFLEQMMRVQDKPRSEQKESFLRPDNFVPRAPSIPFTKTGSAEDPRKEYWLTGGHLFRYLKLYGRLPDENSWIWASYPEGDWWKEAAKKHGLAVIDKVLPFKKPGMGKPTIESELGAQVTVVQSE